QPPGLRRLRGEAAGHQRSGIQAIARRRADQVQHLTGYEERAMVCALRARSGAGAQRRLFARPRRDDRRRGAAPESTAARADVRHVADRLLPLLPHRPVTRAAGKLAVREERSGDLAESERDSAKCAGVSRVPGAAARDSTAGGEISLMWGRASARPETG